MIVAVRADAQAGHAASRIRRIALLHFLFARQQFVGGRIPFAASAQQLHCAHGLRADMLINRSLIMRRDRLRSECRNVVARRQRKMHLRRAAPEDFGVSEIEADGLLCDFRRRFVGDCEQRFRRRRFASRSAAADR